MNSAYEPIAFHIFGFGVGQAAVIGAGLLLAVVFITAVRTTGRLLGRRYKPSTVNATNGSRMHVAHRVWHHNRLSR